jgi:hypothetical protein
MSWQRTHDWWDALREAEAAIDRDGMLPWRARYERLFGDRHGLLLALRYRWSLLVEAQVDPTLPEHLRDQMRRDLTARHTRLLRVLDSLDEPSYLRSPA